MTQETLDQVVKNLDKEFKTVHDILVAGHYKTKITKVEKQNSHTFYGNDEFELRTGLEITIEDGKTFFIPIPERLIGSNMAKFMMRYGGAPKKDMPIDIDIRGEFDTIMF